MPCLPSRWTSTSTSGFRIIETRGEMANRRVAILGGGPAALALAFDLAKYPDLYDLTIYTLGWRLGGKCASGRNADVGMRNEEHGLHLPMGFYENFFDQIRQAYAEVGPKLGPLSSWDRAFLPRSTLTLEEKMGDAWYDWPLHFPPMPGVPGDRARALIDGQAVPSSTLADAVQKILEWLQQYADEHHRTHPALAPQYTSFLQRGPILAAITWIERTVAGVMAEDVDLALDAFGVFLRDVLWPIVAPRLDQDIVLRKLWILMDLGYASARGLLRLIAAGGQLADLDVDDFTAWLDDNAVFDE